MIASEKDTTSALVFLLASLSAPAPTCNDCIVCAVAVGVGKTSFCLRM